MNILQDQKTTILELISDLKQNVFTQQNEQGDLVLVEFFIKRLHPERIMSNIVKNVLPHDKQISKRDSKFFISNKTIFSGLPQDRVDHYSYIIANKLNTEDLEVIWEYFDTIVSLAKVYKKNK